LDSTAKIGTQAGISVDLLSPNAFSEIVANFGNETVAGSSINAIPPEIEPALDTAPINNSVNFLLGDNSNAQLLIDPPDLVAMTRLLPFAIGNVISKQEDSNGIQLSAHQIGGDITPTSEMPSVTFLANAHDLISGTPPKDELGGPLNITDLLAARDGQNSVLGVMPSKQGAVLTQALPSTAPLVEGTLTSALPLADKKSPLNTDLLAARDGQNSVLGVMPSKQGAVLTQALPSTAPLVEGTLTSALPLADKKLTLNADLLAARDGQNSVLGVMPSKQGAVLTQALPSTAPLVKGTLTSALPLADKKLVPTDTKTPVETTLKSIGNFTKSSMEDLPVVPARVAVSLGATPLPEKAVSQTVDPTILRDSGLQSAASNALLNTGLEVEIGQGKKQSVFTDPSAMATPQIATPPSIPTQPVMSDLTRIVATNPERLVPLTSNASALETIAAISGVDTAPGGTGGQSQSGNAQTGTGTNNQQGMAQSQTLATVLDVQRQGWTKALVNRAMSMVQSGGTMTFKVMPAHLGMITLKLSEGRRGTDLRIVADVAATASMLRDVKHQISAAFESAGITLGEYSAGTNDRGDKGSTSQNYDKVESDAEPKIRLNQDITEISNYSGDDRSSINIIL
jgi:predicted transcriptional regulator